MATYATKNELEDWANVTFSSSAEAERLLENAERDVDSVVGIWSRETNGLKFGSPKTTNEKSLEDFQVQQLARAVCAQAEYRLHMGEDFFIEPQVPTQGPDYSTTRALPFIGPKVMPELEATGLIKATGKIGSKGRKPDWYSFSYNYDEDDE